MQTIRREHFNRIRRQELPAASYSGKCSLCEDLIRQEHDRAVIKAKPLAPEIAHRSCFEQYLQLGEAHR